MTSTAMSSSTLFGEIDLYRVLSECRGKLQVQLIDAGMVRDFKQDYEFGQVEDDHRYIWIRPSAPASAIPVKVPSIVPLTPQSLIFFGMYDGDGNKTGDIGFAQNNTRLQALVYRGIEVVFPNLFPARVNILEDSKAFDSEEAAKALTTIQEEIQAKSGGVPTIREAQNEYLRREFLEMNMDIGNILRVDVTVSPKKGGQTAGSRSYEIIVNRAGSRPYLPLLLYLIKQTIFSAQNPGHIPGITWHVHPQREALQLLDVAKYVQSDRCSYITLSGDRRRYRVARSNDSTIEIQKPPRGELVKVPRLLPLTPLLCLMFGVYWAEGTTTKEKLYGFADQHEERLSIGFNSSEDASLRLFLDAISQVFVEPQQIVSGWLVKIGAKYHAEMRWTGLSRHGNGPD